MEEEEELETEEPVKVVGRCDVDRCIAKLHTRGLWVLIMVLLGTFEVFINWMNALQLSKVDIEYGLITGPAPHIAWIFLIAFSVISTVFFIPEMANTFSVFCYDGATMISLIYELVFTLAFKHVPLNALNYYIALCRGQYFTVLQTFCSTSHILYVFVRLLWYAHMEGKILRTSDGSKVRNALFLVCCALFATSMAMPIMCWRSRPSSRLTDALVQNASLFLFNSESFDVARLPNYDVSQLVLDEGRDFRHPALIPSLLEVTNAGPSGVKATFKCRPHMNLTFSPEECRNSTSLVFKFVYQKKIAACPYGTIRYNFATVRKGQNLPPNGTCVEAEKEISWSLHYLHVMPQVRGRKTRIVVDRPWTRTCISPTPWYDKHIHVCP